jgi:hypothetical protein
MRLSAFIILCVVATLCASAGQSAEISVSTGRMSSSLRATLTLNKPLYVEVDYSSDVPLRFQARAYADGVSVDRGQMMNASIEHPAGKGSALVWVRFRQEATVDEIRITAYDLNWKPLQVRSLKADLRWSGTTLGDGRHGRPAWVQSLQDEQDRVSALRQEQYDDSDAAWFGSFIGLIMMLGVPGYFVLQFVAAKKLDRGWRLASYAPLAVMVPVTGHAILALAAGSNLWPILIIFCAPVALLYLLALYVVRAAGAIWAKSA